VGAIEIEEVVTRVQGSRLIKLKAVSSRKLTRSKNVPFWALFRPLHSTFTIQMCYKHSCYTPGNDSGVRGALAVVGLAWLVQTGYWALRAELIVYLC